MIACVMTTFSYKSTIVHLITQTKSCVPKIFSEKRLFEIQPKVKINNLEICGSREINYYITVDNYQYLHFDKFKELKVFKY